VRQERAVLTDGDFELWEWFQERFEHCNQGIMGRGKDRRVKRIKVDEIESRNGNRAELALAEPLRASKVV
jgi:hypothetical protein